MSAACRHTCPLPASRGWLRLAPSGSRGSRRSPPDNLAYIIYTSGSTALRRASRLTATSPALRRLPPLLRLGRPSLRSPTPSLRLLVWELWARSSTAGPVVPTYWFIRSPSFSNCSGSSSDGANADPSAFVRNYAGRAGAARPRLWAAARHLRREASTRGCCARGSSGTVTLLRASSTVRVRNDRHALRS